MNQFKKVSFYTLGCKLNFSETSTIGRLFENEGFAKVDFNDSPDVYVINTCSVTENADKKCKQLVKKAMGVNPDAFIAIIGCYAQLKPTEIAAIPGVDLVLGANEKFNILQHLDSLEKKSKAHIENKEIKQTNQFVPSFSIGDRTRSFLKIQDGCDYFCSFCTIPLARGFSRSNTIEATLKTAKEVAESGVKEIVLTGVNIGDFGAGTDENFLGLIRELDKIEGIERFRISSIEPNLLNDEIIRFVSQSERFAPHFHIPLQSGSDKILKLMRRRYERQLYADRVNAIKSLLPNGCVGVDVIVGFPGESEQEFMETYEFIQNLPVSYLHVFTYSERANTTAIRSNEVVPMEIRNKRSKMLHILSEKKKRAFYESQLNKIETVLFESDEEDGYMHGFTSNYVKVKTAFDASLINQLAEVKMLKVDGNGIMEISLEKILIPQIAG